LLVNGNNQIESSFDTPVDADPVVFSVMMQNDNMPSCQLRCRINDRIPIGAPARQVCCHLGNENELTYDKATMLRGRQLKHI